MKFIDWYIAGMVGAAVGALLALAFKHPDPVIIGAICGAVPTILGLFHWFTMKDDKVSDAEGR